MVPVLAACAIELEQWEERLSLRLDSEQLTSTHEVPNVLLGHVKQPDDLTQQARRPQPACHLLAGVARHANRGPV